jgi:hypothetical protein
MKMTFLALSLAFIGSLATDAAVSKEARRADLLIGDGYEIKSVTFTLTGIAVLVLQKQNTAYICITLETQNITDVDGGLFSPAMDLYFAGWAMRGQVDRPTARPQSVR